ncbi:MAG: DUF5916 domain-containing protein [Bacteroidota bacterium]
MRKFKSSTVEQNKFVQSINILAYIFAVHRPTFAVRRLFWMCSLVFCSQFLYANSGGGGGDNGEDRQQAYQLHITRAKEKIKLDGQLTESTWQNAQSASDLWLSFPVDDERAKLNSTFKVAYDDNFLYIAAEMADPNGTIIQTLKRDVDFWGGDNIVVVLDPVNQKSNGFMFGVNPYGVQMEGLLTGNTGSRGSRPGSGSMNDDWDNKWYSKASRGPNSWTVEMAIPFKTLRYDETKTTWGINFIRTEASNNTFQVWSQVPVQFRSVDLNYTGALVWDQPPKKAKGNVAIIPYISGSTFQDFTEDVPRDNSVNAGVDAKIAVTSSLNLDVTVNPDFSQVEVDQQVTNLTRFNIRLPEQRLFFLENTDIFADFGNSPARPFFSRRIGLDDDGNAIPILYGLRLTGNATKSLRVGVLNMQTKQTDDFAGQNYTATAFHQQVFGRSVIKGYFTNRQAYQDSEFSSTDYGRNAGLEFNYISDNNKWQSWAGYSHSFKEGIDDKNTYFKVGTRYRDRNWTVIVNYYELQNNYFADLGFINRVNHYNAVQDTTYRIGFGSLFTDVNYTILPKKKNSKITNQRIGAFNWWVTKADGGEFMERTNALSYRISFVGRSSFGIRAGNSSLELQHPFSFTGDEPLPAQRYTTSDLRLDYRSDGRKNFFYEVNFRYGGFYSGTRTGFEVEGNYRVQPWGNFGLNFTYNDLQFGGPYGERQLFSVSPRIEINFSNNLWWTTFIQYNTQAENFNINSRLQWRFAPMSDIFLVYTDNYFAETDDSAESFRIRNFGPKNRALVFKVNYWFTL